MSFQIPTADDLVDFIKDFTGSSNDAEIKKCIFLAEMSMRNIELPALRTDPYTTIGVANELGYEHLYVGQGYEIGSAYKSSFKGFEWWTGADWSSDIERYKTLCARDSTINTLEDLAIAYRGKY